MFNGCGLPVLSGGKCEFHRYRTKCKIDGCFNQVYARRLCVGHGGKDSCQFPNCHAPVRSGKLCSKHYVKPVAICTEDGCQNIAQDKVKCRQHANQGCCAIDGCELRPQSTGLCWRHRNRIIPSISNPKEDLMCNLDERKFDSSTRVDSSWDSSPIDDTLVCLDLYPQASPLDIVWDAFDFDFALQDKDILADSTDSLLRFEGMLDSHGSSSILVKVFILTFPMSSQSCLFNGCSNPILEGSTKCEFHRNRNKCIVADCFNQVYARQLCIRHGGKRLCQFPDCYTNARTGDLCAKHGGDKTKALCTEPGCTKKAHLKNKCIRHGGGKPCSMANCESHARIGGFCWRHRVRSDKVCIPPELIPSSDEEESDELMQLLDLWMSEECTIEPHTQGSPDKVHIAKYALLNPHTQVSPAKVQT
ncbi:hypothetical protein THRCLA_20059 [Thraustotheca clavata]|uniref:WRKY19-like zinc finger domain-containing protein n=1 Tax=Thraustotheca clavata TaxID=74557 RepID=A0A1W0AC63_9STRA|nr:hypothetical protein THRCLA_20059 [Thraustotheca clavata]